MDKVAWHSMLHTEAVSAIDSHLERGLTSEEATARMAKYGKNELKGKTPPTVWEMLLGQFKDFLVLILIGAALISGLMGEWVEAAAIIVVVLINAVLGVVQELRAEKALEALQKMASPTCKVTRDGQQLVIPGRELVPGDIVSLEAGDYVPADIRLIESINLKIEEAALTGESVPAEKDAQAVIQGEVPAGDRHNSAFMGTFVTYGRARGLVVATGMNTEIGLIAQMIESYEEEDTPLQKKLAQLGRLLGVGVLIICAIVFATGLLRGEPALRMLLVAVSLAVAAVPEGLPAIVTIVLALGMQRMVTKNAIVKKMHAVETLGSTTVICTDKTGTLTQNEMMVVKIYADGYFLDVTGEGYRPEGTFSLGQKVINPLENQTISALLQAAVLCNDARLNPSTTDTDHWRIFGDPTEGALLTVGAKAGLSQEELNKQYPRQQEIPFDSARKRMTTIHAQPKGDDKALIKGAPDVLLALCDRILINGEERPLTDKDIQSINQANSDMARSALRVLAFSYRSYAEMPANTHAKGVESNLVFIGLMGMIDPPRPEAKHAIAVCQKAGIRAVMITGDYRDTAVAIAKDLELIRDESRVLEGTELNEMTDEDLRQKVDHVDVYARVSPEHKMKIIEALKTQNHIVAMTGDGVNDAPALKRADIGIAMGITGTDVSKETANMILTDDNFASIVSAVEEGRVIFSNIRKSVLFLLSCNIGEVSIVFLAMVLGLGEPLLAIHLLWINLLTDAFPALALGMEKQAPHIMDAPPRNPSAPLLDRHMLTKLAVQSTVLTVATLGAYIYGLINYGRTGEELVIARTMAFLTLTLAELLRAYSSRSEQYSVFKLGFFSNKYLNLGVSVSLILVAATVLVPPLRIVFETKMLTGQQYGVVLGFAVMPFIAAEISKLRLR